MDVGRKRHETSRMRCETINPRRRPKEKASKKQSETATHSTLLPSSGPSYPRPLEDAPSPLDSLILPPLPIHLPLTMPVPLLPLLLTRRSLSSVPGFISEAADAHSQPRSRPRSREPRAGSRARLAEGGSRSTGRDEAHRGDGSVSLGRGGGGGGERGRREQD